MSKINKVNSFLSVLDMVHTAIDRLEDSDLYNTIGFIGYGNIISDILGELLSEYNLDITYIHMDEFLYDDLYQLTIDEDYLISVEPVKNDNGDYRLSSVDMQFVSDLVSTKYVRLLENNKVQYELFDIIDNEQYNFSEIDSDDIIESDSDYKDTDNIVVMCTKYTNLSSVEKQLINAILDWAL